MRTLVLARRFWPPWHDGIISYTKGLVEMLTSASTAARQTSVDVLSLQKPIQTETKWHDELREYRKRIGIRVLFAEERRDGDSSVWETLSWLRKNGDYDVVHITCDGFGPFLANLVLGGLHSREGPRLLKYLFVAPVHKHWHLERNYYRILESTRVCPSLTFVYSCNTLRELYGTRNNWILPPAVDTSFYRPMEASRSDVFRFLNESKDGIGNLSQTLNRERIVLYMGPLTRDRFPFRHLVSALCKDSSRLSNTGLLIIGRGRKYEEGGFLQEIEREVRDHNLQENVFLCRKRLTEEEKLCLFNSSDLLFYPLQIDQLKLSVVVPPLAVLEAMATGTPVLTGGLPMLRGLIKHKENGFLIEELTADCIAKTLSIALDDSEENLSRLARERVEKDFSISSVAKMLKECIEVLTA